MKSILLSIKPEWLAKILNGKKTIEVRKLFPKDYVGWVYLYCSKDKKNKLEYCDINDGCWCANDGGDYYNGKVVARFWCDKVEEIVCQNAFNEPTYNTELLSERDLCIKSCLGLFGLFDYLGNKNGFAIHISKLEIFDRPKELNELYACKLGWNNCVPHNCNECPCKYNLIKAPQSFMYIEGE